VLGGTGQASWRARGRAAIATGAFVVGTRWVGVFKMAGGVRRGCAGRAAPVPAAGEACASGFGSGLPAAGLGRVSGTVVSRVRAG
jgi:hypothetical protein